MCLLAFLLPSEPGQPWFLLANREEVRARPTQLPAIYTAESNLPAWMGGIDLLAGGTWLGVNSHGLLAAVTNRPDGPNHRKPLSRGALCRSLLRHKYADRAIDQLIGDLESRKYPGCNLVVVSESRAIVVHAGTRIEVREISPGLSVVTNGDLNAESDPRIARVRNELDTSAIHDANSWVAAARRICRLGAGEGKPALCLAGGPRGTVSSTIVALSKHLPDCHYQYAPGPPSEADYIDLSASFRELFSSQKNEPVPGL
jgi:uncharacterized protein with NRDE domain